MASSKPRSTAAFRTAWALLASLICRPNGLASGESLALGRRSNANRTASLSNPSLFPGKREFRRGDKPRKNAPETDLRCRRDRSPKRKPGNCGPFASVQEISVRAGVRGGPGRPSSIQRVQQLIVSHLCLMSHCVPMRIFEIVPPSVVALMASGGRRKLTLASNRAAGA